MSPESTTTLSSTCWRFERVVAPWDVGMVVRETQKVNTAATLLRRRGFALCKPARADKKPTYKEWPTRSLEPHEFGPHDMLGVIGGPLSDGGRLGHATVIIDLDTAEANARADDFLVDTPMVEGRAGKPRSHRYYLVPVETIPDWAKSTADQGAAAALKKTGHPGPFTKSFRHRETNAEVFKFVGTGGQCVCPPSVWSNGTRTELREWEGGEPGEPASVPFLDLWRPCCELASACGAKIPAAPPKSAGWTVRTPNDVIDRAVKYLEKIPGAVSGCGGHNLTFAAARAAVYGFDLGAQVGFELLRDHYNLRCVPPWSERDLRHKCEDADRAPFDRPRGYLRDAAMPALNGTAHGQSTVGVVDLSAGEPPKSYSFDDTDIANGRRFIADHGEDVRYVADWGQWVVYDGRCWEVDRSETRIERLAKETADRMAWEAAAEVGELARSIAAAGDEEEASLKSAMRKAQAALRHAKKSADMRAVRRMVQAARSEPAVCVPRGGDVFDTRRDLLNCPNGTVELRTGSLREHRRGDYITRLCPTRFHPDAPRAEYLAFLDKVFDGKPEVAKYVREFAGYAVTGEVSDQTLHIFNGDGSNGKNVFTDLLVAVLGEGEYAHTAAAELLVGDAWERRHPTEKTGLRGARLVVCSETGEDGTLDETKMKALTGGDTVNARYMRGDFFQFLPTHKLLLLTNNRPRVKGTDHGVWRRLRLVPFAVRFWKDADRELDPGGDYPERFKADPKLGERLRTAESEGVLADAVEHAAAFYSAGMALSPPAAVAGATAEYRADQDTIGQYFAACVREDSGGRLKASDFYGAFKAWWEGEGHPGNKVPGPTKFGKEAKRKFRWSKPSGIAYHVRLLPECLSDEAPEGRKVGGDPREKFSRARAQ